MKTAASENWIISKPVVTAAGGIVVSQHYEASQVGASVLTQGGNAVDAAIAASMALGVVEPWMSGVGGCGNLLVYQARENRTYAIGCGVRAPLSLDVDRYALVGGQDNDLFAWPAVVDDRNVYGPESVAVPGLVAGLGLALKRFGSCSWTSLLSPAIELANRGLVVDWYSSLKIASAARHLADFADSAGCFLPNGHVPIAEWGGSPPLLDQRALAGTLVQLAEQGPGAFYRGSLARKLVRAAHTVGIPLTDDDLAGYVPSESVVVDFPYRDVQISAAPGMTAGSTLCRALDALQSDPPPLVDVGDTAHAYIRYAACLQDAYAYRLAHDGDMPEGSIPSCTTHLNVIDRDGNVVSLTQTLLSIFGSKVVLPETGVLMNNGIMWFDPRPGRANSIAAGKWPLSNMCPVIVHHANGDKTALGASGGRRIMPAVFQLISFLVDAGMSLADAMHWPRIDVSGSDLVSLDDRLDPVVRASIRSQWPVRTVGHGVYPSLFACPSVARMERHRGRTSGVAYVLSPLSAAIAEEQVK
ncbi:MAG: gamma-glutamyltransferase [Pseudomonadota bacterium]|nr:gamma-glutamyltransferase [Pseudomonadota bacterium]